MAISKEVREQVLARDKSACQLCGTQLDRRIAQLDHIKPRSQGGTSDVSNLRTVCPMCNYQLGRILDAVASPSRELAAGWIKAFLKAPVTTGLVSGLLGIGAAIGIKLYSVQQGREREAQRSASADYATQLTKLNDTEQKLRELLSFVTNQREALRQTEDALATLKSQRDSLAPLVESQKAVVDSLFAAQEQRNRQTAKSERWIGFWLGIASSIVASTCLGIVNFFVRRRVARRTGLESENLAGA
jgi:hypothetical protein